MLPINDFTVCRIRGPSAEQPPLVQLLFHGRDAGEVLPGAVLERQFRVSDGRYLIFLTDDTPYEETLRIYLLSDSFRVLDGLEFGSAYVTGHLDDVVATDPDTIEFSFVHKARCRVTIKAAGHWSLTPRFTPGLTRIGPWYSRRFLEIAFVNA